MSDQEPYRRMIERMVELDPSTKEVVETMRRQQGKSWGQVVACFRVRMAELGIAASQG